MLFWIFLSLLCAFSIAPTALAWKNADGKAVGNSSHNRVLYNARLSEIDTDFELGRIDSLARDAAIAEEGRRFIRLEETSSPATNDVTSSKLALIIPVIFLAVPAFSLGLYTHLGVPEVGTATVANHDQQTQPSLEELMKIAEKRLKIEPDDARGWRVLAPVYIRSGRYEDAEKAYRNLIRLDGMDIDARQALAELLVFRNENRISDEALALFKGIDGSRPGHPRASYFLGLAAQQRGETDKARIIWQQLLEDAKGDEPWLSTVRDQLTGLDEGKSGVPNLSEEQMLRVEGMVAGLASRLEEERGTPQDWERLVRSYMVLERVNDATNAYQRASELFAEDAELLTILKRLISNGKSGKPKP